ncbi:MAG: chemotaxis protein CheD [Polyangiales bacterium]
MSHHYTTLRIGGVYASDKPDAVIRTVLGSCIAACLFDPVSRVGGMNHFMLPCADERDTEDLTRFGAHAMEVLIGAIQRLGGARPRLKAKLFGGGHVLNTAPSLRSVAARNIAFIEHYMHEEGIEVMSQDLGGYLARRVHFYPHSGKAMVKRLGEAALRELQLEETQVARLPTPLLDSEITLFD